MTSRYCGNNRAASSVSWCPAAGVLSENLCTACVTLAHWAPHLVSPYQRSREKAMADSPVFVPSGAAVPTSPTPSESRAASPDGVETDPAQHCRDRDITEIDGEALGQSAQLSMAAAPVNWAGSIDSGRGQSSPMRGQQVQATSSLNLLSPHCLLYTSPSPRD